MNPQPTWAELEDYYTASYDPYDPSHGAEAPDDVIVAKARRDGEFRHVRISPGTRLLGVGGGAGFFPRIAARFGAEVQGVEPSDIAASRARESGIPVFTGTVEDYAGSSGDRQFDLITANHVLEHTGPCSDSRGDEGAARAGWAVLDRCTEFGLHIQP
jgi:hypothetical protein